MRPTGGHFIGSSWVSPAPSTSSKHQSKSYCSEGFLDTLELILLEGAARLLSSRRPAERIWNIRAKIQRTIAVWFNLFRVFGVFRGLEPFVLFVFLCPDFLRSNGPFVMDDPYACSGETRSGDFQIAVWVGRRSGDRRSLLKRGANVLALQPSSSPQRLTRRFEVEDL